MLKVPLNRGALSATLLAVFPGFAAVVMWCATAFASLPIAALAPSNAAWPPTESAPLNAPTNCNAAIDIVLVVDSSGSIALTAGAFDRIKTFANSVVSSFTVTLAGARFGLVDFSNRTDTRLILGLTGDAQAIHAAIDTIPFFGNGTDTSSGLAQAQAELEANGRTGVHRAIILITDGRADDGPAAVSAATNSKAAGTKIFAIGVTSQINFAELQQIASEPVSSTVFTVDDFSTLPGILQQLVVDVCAPTGADLSVTKSGTPNPVLVGGNLTYALTVSNLGPNRANGIVLTDTLPKEAGFVSANAMQGNCSQAGGIITCSLGVLEKGAAATITILTTALNTGLSATCGEALEILLVVDSSGSIALSAGAFERVQTFAKSIVSAFNVSSTGTRFGLVDFSGRTDTRLILGLSGDSQMIQTAIDTLPFFGNDTYTAPGLSQAQAELEAHGRVGVNRAIILITDGEADDGPEAIRVASNSKAAGTKIFAIGVTARINFVQLQQIASEPVRNTVFTADDFAGLSAILQQLIVNVCPPNPAITITNRASVIAIESDPNPSNNNTETATVVLHELPRLSIVRGIDTAVIAWPDWATPIFLLESTPSLSSALPWTTVTTAPLRVGTQDTVTVDSRIGQTYYRLRSRL